MFLGLLYLLNEIRKYIVKLICLRLAEILKKNVFFN